MNRILVIVIAVLCVFNLNAQTDLLYKNIKWEKNPVLSKIDEKYKDQQIIELFYSRIVEQAYIEKYENNLLEYFTIHRKVRVNSDDAVQEYNKVYIGMYNVAELIEAKARVITPDGEVVEFDESNIIDNLGENGEIEYKNFAIDGVVVGSDVEYTYTVLRSANYEGTFFKFQTDHLRLNVDFTLATPKNLVFDSKSYNGFPELNLDTNYSEKNVLFAKIDVIEALKDEEYSAYDRELMSLVYKLDENTATGSSNFISFGKVSQNIYSFYYQDLEKKDIKALKKLIANSGAMKQNNEEAKIRALESYLKTNIVVVDYVPRKSVSEIIKDKYTTNKGLVLLFIQALREMEIKHEMVITTDRMEKYFDADFEHYAVLNNLMIYFPNIDMLLAPDEELFRLGLVPDSWTAENGLFIKTVKVGDMHTGLGKVKFIEPIKAEQTHDNMDVTVDFSDISEPIVKFKRELSGYTSVYFQGVYNLIDADNKKELDESLIMFADSKGEVLKYSVSGIEPEDVGVNPVVYEGELKTSSLIEKAGNRYLFNIGNLIGAQHEMYREEERKTNIEHSHNMVYHRVIRFEIPDGYELKGLEKLKINEVYPLDKPTIRFTSDYTVNGNMVEITVVERYDKVFFPKEEIDGFRNIINAAANFNKIALFLVKK